MVFDILEKIRKEVKIMTFLVEPMSKLINTSFAPCNDKQGSCTCQCMNDAYCGAADIA